MEQKNFLKNRKLLILFFAALILALAFLNREKIFPSASKVDTGAQENVTTSQKNASRFMVQPLSPGFH